MSPDPCQETSSTCESSYLQEKRAGRKRVRPTFTRISDLRRACRKVRGWGRMPARASSMGLANSSNVTMVETGFPGRPKKYLCEAFTDAGADVPERANRSLPYELLRPKTTGFPG